MGGEGVAVNVTVSPSLSSAVTLPCPPAWPGAGDTSFPPSLSLPVSSFMFCHPNRVSLVVVVFYHGVSVPFPGFCHSKQRAEFVLW